MDVILHVLSWNGEKYLPDLFDSLDAQTKKDCVVRVVDNGSTDGSVKYLQDHHSHSLILRNAKNLGFAPGHNQLFKFTFERFTGQDLSKKLILLVNQDMILDAQLVEKLSQAFERDEQLAVAQPKIYRLFPSNEDEGVQLPTKSDVLDTTGLLLTKGWHFEDRGAGEIDTGQYDAKTDIIGASGALVMYRASALLDVLVDGEIFDDDFFAYREDCDLALRLTRAGWKSAFVPLAKAWHYRGIFGAQKRTWFERLKDRRGRRPFLAALSTRNQLLMMVKNLTFSDVVLSAPFIVLGEGIRLFYGMLFEPATRKLMLTSAPYFWRAFKKRKIVLAKAKVPPAHVRSYIGA